MFAEYTITIPCDFNYKYRKTFITMLYDLLKTDTYEKLILDFNNVKTIDSVGIGLLYLLKQQSLNKKITYEFINVNEHIQNIFEIMKINTLFKICKL